MLTEASLSVLSHEAEGYAHTGSAHPLLDLLGGRPYRFVDIGEEIGSPRILVTASLSKRTIIPESGPSFQIDTGVYGQITTGLLEASGEAGKKLQQSLLDMLKDQLEGHIPKIVIVQLTSTGVVALDNRSPKAFVKTVGRRGTIGPVISLTSAQLDQLLGENFHARGMLTHLNRQKRKGKKPVIAL